MKKSALFITLVLLAGVLLAVTQPAAAENTAQVFYATPTPNADGRIVYIVQPGDNCTTISLKTFVNIDELKVLNNIQGPDCALTAGQELLLGVAPAQPAASPTPELPAGPTSTPELSTGQICVYVFNDINGNGIPEVVTEGAIEGGAVSITDRLGKVSLTGATAGLDPLCFDAIPAGEYNISVAVPEGYNATTDLNYPLTLRGGDKSTLDFGAQLSSAGAPASPAEGGQSVVLGIMGLVLVLGGIGLGVYMLLIRRKTY
jgi:hypothetical protein